MMTEKTKRKAEQIARRRKWMGRLTVYLILVLIGLILIAFDHHSPLGPFIDTLSFLPGISVAFVVAPLIDAIAPPPGMPPPVNPIALLFSACAGIVVFALVSGYLQILLG